MYDRWYETVLAGRAYRVLHRRQKRLFCGDMARKIGLFGGWGQGGSSMTLISTTDPRLTATERNLNRLCQTGSQFKDAMLPPQ